MKEHKHFNMRRLLTVVLMLALVLSTAATGYAADLTESVCENPDPGKVIKTDWTNFRGNNTHNAVTKNPVPTKASEAALLWATKSGTGYGAQAVGSPILVDGYLYYNQGKTINKMDAISGERVASAPMVNNSSFSIVPPTYADGKIFVGLAGGIVQAFDAKTLKSLWVYTDKLGGQPNCPITYYDGYVYTGFWNSETRDANFVCLSVKDENTKKTNEAKKAKWTYTSKGGFYWAGAYVCKNFVLVGTDDGDSAYTEQTSNLLSLDPKTGALLDKKSGLNADIRSNVSYDKTTDRYYFTSKGGSFYAAKVSAKGKITDLKELDLGGMSTSTPAIYNGRAYVGVSGPGQFAKYNGHNITVVDLKTWKIAYRAYTMGYPQTSGLVYTGAGDGYTYVYFFENMTPGKLRYIKDKPGLTEPVDAVIENDGTKDWVCAPTLFTPQGAQAQYAICSPIVDEYGTIYFKNDSAQMMALGSKIKKITVSKLPTQTTYDIGDVFNPAGMKVEAVLTNGKRMDISQYVQYGADSLTAKDSDVLIYYANQMYNDETQLDTLYATVDIKVNDAKTSEVNNAAKRQIKAAQPALTVKAGKKSAVLSWKKVSNANGYQILSFFQKSGGFKSVKTITKGSVLTYTDKSLASGKTGYYKIRAYRTINKAPYYSKWSAVKSAKAK